MRLTNTYSVKDKSWKYTGTPEKDIDSLKKFCNKLRGKTSKKTLGKVVYSTCMLWWPEESDMFTGSVIDPSKDDSKIDSFLKAVFFMVNRRLIKEWNEARRGY